MTDQYLSLDELIDTAYDIFLEMAQDNLEPADLLLFTAQFDDRGAAEIAPLGADWQAHTGFDVDEQFFAEVRIGLVNATNDQLDDIFARLLIHRERDEKYCHVLWKREA